MCKNAKTLASHLTQKGYTLVTGGTDNHLILWDLRQQHLTGSKIEKLAEMCNITVNKNTVPGDTSALSPGGIRIGVCALTTRGFKDDEFIHVADFLDRLIKIASKIQNISGKKLKDFVNEATKSDDVIILKKDISSFASSFFMPG